MIKTDADGIQQWNLTFGGKKDDWTRSVQQTLDGGSILAGGTNSYRAGGTPTQTAARETKVSPTEKTIGFEIVPAIIVLLAVYIFGLKYLRMN